MTVLDRALSPPKPLVRFRYFFSYSSPKSLFLHTLCILMSYISYSLKLFQSTSGQNSGQKKSIKVIWLMALHSKVRQKVSPLHSFVYLRWFQSDGNQVLSKDVEA